MKRKMKVLIDDQRDLGADITCRTSAKARRILKQKKTDFLMIDHDLGGNENGYDILKWALEKGYAPSKIRLVTENPYGHASMAALLKHFGYKSSSNRRDFKLTFKKKLTCRTYY